MGGGEGIGGSGPSTGIDGPPGQGTASGEGAEMAWQGTAHAAGISHYPCQAAAPGIEGVAAGISAIAASAGIAPGVAEATAVAGIAPG
eukprot:2094173-Alexandrium_andersonii.AAC.1